MQLWSLFAAFSERQDVMSPTCWSQKAYPYVCLWPCLMSTAAIVVRHAVTDEG